MSRAILERRGLPDMICENNRLIYRFLLPLTPSYERLFKSLNYSVHGMIRSDMYCRTRENIHFKKTLLRKNPLFKKIHFLKNPLFQKNPLF